MPAAVAPFVGAWIEIHIRKSCSKITLVAPFVGAWIEMYQCDKADYVIFVAPFVGAWIEIYNEMMQQPAGTVSLRSSERGLKYPYSAQCVGG